MDESGGAYDGATANFYLCRAHVVFFDVAQDGGLGDSGEFHGFVYVDVALGYSVDLVGE